MSELSAKIIDIGDESMLGLCGDGRKIWLEGPAVPGDRVQFDLRGKTGRVTAIQEPAGDRREARCPHFERCPGCQLQPLPHARQLELKGRKIVEALRRLGGFTEVPFSGVTATPTEYGTRNKLDFSVEGGEIGYQTREGLLPVSVCPAGDPLFAPVMDSFRSWLGSHPRHRLHRLMLRADSDRKDVLVLLRGELAAAEEEALRAWGAACGETVSGVSIQQDWRAPWRDLCGNGERRFVLAGQTHTLRHDAFFQVHDRLADRLVRDAVSSLGAAKGGLLDLYCGAGAFTLPAIREGWRAAGVDSRPGKGPFHRADLRKGLPPEVLKQSWRTVLTDPPRAGMEKILCAQIRDRLKPEILVYVSCNPATLARDLQRICSKDSYRLINVQGYDLFPQTTHVETLAVLKKHPGG